METIKIAGVKREAFGKKESKSIRKQGQVPCVIYGNGETVHFSVDARSLKPLIYTPQSFLIEFDIDLERRYKESNSDWAKADIEAYMEKSGRKSSYFRRLSHRSG